ncbi:MAG: septation regulator SpoVG [Ruminococcaceae bacterium]|nr:septation regulator SpoVG [Oscillospiraceae bacterium]
MQITDVKIRKTFTEGPMLAVASITLDGVFVVHDVKVILANDRRFIVMPSRKNPDGTYRDIAHPITADFRAMLEECVLAAYEKALAEAPAEEIL